jgi:transcriptional regulator with XRE-family HTH domain
MLGSEQNVDSATRISSLRRHLELSQIEFANRLQVTQATVSKWERGAILLSLEFCDQVTARLTSNGQSVVNLSLEGATFDECLTSYQEYLRLVAERPQDEADLYAGEICARLELLSCRNPQAKQLLGTVYASRAYWHLPRWNRLGVEQNAKKAIKIAQTTGFDINSGYALWALARTRIRCGVRRESDLTLVRNLATISDKYSNETGKMYTSLLMAAQASLQGNAVLSNWHLDRATEQIPQVKDPGLFSSWSVQYWSEAIASYRWMFALSHRKGDSMLDSYLSGDGLVEPFTDISKHYLQAALVQSGSRERIPQSKSVLHPFTLETIRKHTTIVSGYRYR